MLRPVVAGIPTSGCYQSHREHDTWSYLAQTSHKDWSTHNARQILRSTTPALFRVPQHDEGDYCRKQGTLHTCQR